jgi:hypothetical protein
MNARTEELLSIPGLNFLSATVLKAFYEGAVAAGTGSTTAQARVRLLDGIVQLLGGNQ